MLFRSLSTYYRERLLGEAVSRNHADLVLETEWKGRKGWRSAIIDGTRAGWTFQQICGSFSTPHYKIAADVRTAYHLGLIDILPQGLPAPRVVLSATPANDPRQMPLFGEA